MLTALPAIVRRYRKRYSAVHLRLLEMSTTKQLDSLLDGTIDVGVVRAVPADPRLRTEILRQESFVAVLPSHHPARRQGAVPLETFAEEPFVLFPRSVAVELHAEVQSLFRDAGFAPRVVQEAREWLTIVGLVEAALGISIVPESFQKLRWGKVAYQPLKRVGARTAVSVCLHSEKTHPAVLNFVELALEVAQSH